MVRELFLAFLAQHDDAAWLRAVDRIEAAMHPVDRAAVSVWLHIYPLALQQLMERPDAEAIARRMTLAGRWRLADQIDTSHAFLFGHRYWPHARAAVLEYAEHGSPGSLDLGAQVREASELTAARAGVPVDWVVGITTVAMRALQQVGPERLAASPGTTVEEGLYAGLDPDQVLARRMGRRAWWQVFAPRRRPYVVFDERHASARFPLVPSQHLTTAAALDTRPYRQADARCSEGPIPVHCRSCSCGTCWVGVIGGADALSPVDDRERAKLAECGVGTDGGQAPMRLACMAQAYGPVSIVIPSWNGLLGRVRRSAA